MNSTGSSESSERAALQEAIELKEGIVRLGRMAGVESIDRNFATEDAEYERDMRRHGEELAGGDSEPAETGDEMRIMAARDVYVNPSPKPNTRKATGTLTKVALAVAILGPWAGVGAWVLGKALSPPPPPTPTVETPVDTNTQYEARFEVE